MYSLVKVDDPNTGDTGGMSTIMKLSKDGNRVLARLNSKPRVGWVIRVGSLYARTYRYQDWWQTSTITEILEERKDYCRFKTLNSEYEWRKV
jgi:hypothetical protein